MNRTTRTGLLAGAMAIGMVGVSFAAVPLYAMFCAATGFDGTPRRADSAPGAVAGQIGVRFDANISPTLAWKFEPVQNSIRIHPGARTTALYRATNLTARTTTGSAVFNVTPAKAGQYFSKIACFCFSEQTLKGEQTVDLPVVFFVDPKIRTDPSTRTIDEITLSYTFYPVESPARGS
jgi:cytochrome c oxidase assembly protein subunit 11